MGKVKQEEGYAGELQPGRSIMNTTLELSARLRTLSITAVRSFNHVP